MSRAPDLFDVLRDPATYPHLAPGTAIELLQTHLSIVCIVGEQVYKLKKSRTLPFVDFAPLAARRFYCREEVRLNRRLCPDVYLGTTALRRVTGGALRFMQLGDDDGAGDVDVAVLMKKLPADRMLDRMPHEGRATAGQIAELAELVAGFHRAAGRGPAVRAAGDPDRLAGFVRGNFAELGMTRGHGLPGELLAAVQRASEADFARILPELRRRASAGFLVDGHGDLHARNVCMTEPPSIYDCIEFSAHFRCGDVATENAFLVMDLRYRGHPELAAVYSDAYAAASGDDAQAALLPPLVCYRAMVRCKVATLAAAEDDLSGADREGARQSARKHLRLAAAVALEGRGPWWLAVIGSPGTGKSTLCRALAANSGWPHVATDVVRKGLAGIAAHERAKPEHYAPAFSDRTYAEVAQRAAAATRDGAPVVLLDGNFPSSRRRADLVEAAEEVRAKVAFVHVQLDARTAARRATARAEQATDASDAGPEQVEALRAAFEDPHPRERLDVLTVDGGASPDALADAILGALLARKAPATR